MCTREPRINCTLPDDFISDEMNTNAGWLLAFFCVFRAWCFAHEFLMGYITGSERRPNELEYSRPGLSVSGAISLAVDEVNERYPIRDGNSLSFVVAETFGEEAQSILNTATLWTQNVSVYIGPQETCVHEARMAAAFNLPMISYFCTRYETSDKTIFPTFARTRPPDVHISKSVASVLMRFRWRKVAFLYSSAKELDFYWIADTIVKTLHVCGIKVIFKKTWDVTYHHGYLDNPFLQLVEETYEDARIYVILGQYYEHLGLMVTMQKKGLFENGEYFVVGVDIEQYDQDNPGMYLRGLLKDETEDIAQVAYQSYIGVIGSPPVGFEEFSIKVNDYMEKEPFNYPNPLTFLGGRKRIRAEAAYLYDAVYVYARALNETLESDEDAFDGRVMFKYMRGQTYKSAMGYIVHMDENGDAEGNYTLVARKPILHSPGQFGLFPIGTFIYTDNDSIPVLRLDSSIDWIGIGPPIDEPRCGFRNELCTSRTSEVIAGVAGGIVLTFMIIVLIAYRNWKYEQELDSLLWKIDFREIKLKEFVPTSGGNGNCKTSRMVHPVIRASQISLNSNPDLDFRYSTIYTQIGYYKGHICAVKWVRKKNIDITRKMKKELKIMRDLHHDNLNSFIGACVDPPNICIITEYCARGSLKDILENVEVQLDNMFIASLVDDIIRGMIYLHDCPIRYHGRLQSSNCLVDSRWVLKITDFGLQEFKDGAELDDQIDSSRYYESLLYRAPELLRGTNPSSNGTQKGDVYSFAIILYEIHCRQGPFGTIDMTPQEILKRVIDGTDAGTPFRPQLELMDNPSDYVKICLRECWNEVAEERPDFKTIRQRIRPQRKGMRSNIFDNMIAMMEKYANNLEALVDEKTDQLIEEKKKTDALLYEMLPRYVIEQLKRGKPVEAESFDTVTIYFSDIVGFTAMSAESTPLQVVDFLNDLYTCFDSIIENYDVYKVETIGDAYMVVSGLPIRNGDSHAGEIASMSLHLLDAVRKFIIRHRPNDKLKLRIGIHSGPVCAGVVGLKMPRYCLFGDTVNTASRMESNGSPLKVHCSYQCRDILDKLGGYTLEERGFIKMKGKGEVKTYWLVSEDEKRREQRIRQKCERISSLRGGCALIWTEKELNGLVRRGKVREETITCDVQRTSVCDGEVSSSPHVSCSTNRGRNVCGAGKCGSIEVLNVKVDCGAKSCNKVDGIDIETPV